MAHTHFQVLDVDTGDLLIEEAEAQFPPEVGHSIGLEDGRTCKVSSLGMTDGILVAKAKIQE